MVSNGSQFSPEMWQRACRCIRDIFTSTVPSELLTWRPEIHSTGTPTPQSTPTHTPDSPVRTLDRHHSFDSVSVLTLPPGPRLNARKISISVYKRLKNKLHSIACLSWHA